MTERQLIRDVKKALVNHCECSSLDRRRRTVCSFCHIVNTIDHGLSDIAKTNDEPRYHSESTEMIGAKTADEVREVQIAELKRKSDESMRSGNMGAAIKLYNRAWDQERRKE